MPLPAGLVAAGKFLSTAAPFIGSWLTGRSNSKREAEMSRYNTDRTIEAQAEMAKYAYNKDLEMWRRNNEYNNPYNQMQRLKSAGLNPNLVYGSGSVTGNTSGQMPRYQAPKPEYNYKPVKLPMDAALNSYTDTMLRQAQVDNLQANVRLIDQRAINESYKEGLIKTDVARKKTALNIETRTKDAKVSTIQSKAKFEAARAEEKQIQAKFTERIKAGTLTQLTLKNELQRMRNKWEKVGVTPRDKLWIRAAVRILPQLNVDMGWLGNIVGKDLLNIVLKDF
ncbi:hypothetical protein [Microviridae sp.]|nr:hypothetical protein [Microviridae sp.]